MPGASYIVSNMSAISARSSSVDLLDGEEIWRRRGSGTSTMGRWPWGGYLVFRCSGSSNRHCVRGALKTWGAWRGAPGRAYLRRDSRAHRPPESVRQLRGANGEFLQPLGDIMRRGLALQSRVMASTTSSMPAAATRPTSVSCQGPRPHAFECDNRRRASDSGRGTAASGRAPQIGDLLDDAQQAVVAARVGADPAGVAVSRLPQAEQVDNRAATSCSAANSGSSALSRFFIKCSTARRAERGPRPGNRASACDKASIWVDAMPPR